MPPSVSLADKREDLCVGLRVMGKHSQRLFSLLVYKKCEFGEEEKGRSCRSERGLATERRDTKARGAMPVQTVSKESFGWWTQYSSNKVSFSCCPRYYNQMPVNICFDSVPPKPIWITMFI